MEGGREDSSSERRRESHAKREQPSGESSMHYKCCEIVGSSGILRMNGFYCSVLITDCCYSSSSFYFYCICAVVDRVLMMMVMIMTLLATRWSNENKTEIIALFLQVWSDQLTDFFWFVMLFRVCHTFEGVNHIFEGMSHFWRVCHIFKGIKGMSHF